MPPITILSPYSGRPVKVREQDMGRAVRDEEGRIFYIVDDPEHGLYAARTRKGSDKDLERYRKMQDTSARLDEDDAVQASRHATVYDATGTKRRNPLGRLVLLIIVLAIGAAAYLVIMQPGLIGLGSQEQDDAKTNTPAESDAGGEQSAAPVDAPNKPTTLAANGPKVVADRQGPKTFFERRAQERSRAATPPVDPTTAQPLVAFEPDPEPVIVSASMARPVEQTIEFVQAEPQASFDRFRHTASGLRYKITHHTDGPAAKPGSVVDVRYTAQTLDGKPLIDDARQSFVLMNGQAIRAFDEGLAGIRQGEQLRLMVPRGHSKGGKLPGIKRLPDEPFLLDLQLVSVRPGVSHIVEQAGDTRKKAAVAGDSLLVHYTVRVEGHDQVIDSTERRDTPLRITLGQSQVIPGLELGLAGMHPGETRLISVPPYLAYGDHSVAGGLIPPNAVLSFRASLVRIEPQDAR